MEKNEVIGLTIVCLVFLGTIIFWITKFIVDLYKDGKYEKEYETIYAAAKKICDDFTVYLNSQDILINTPAYTQLKAQLLAAFNKEFEPVIMEDAEDTLERYKYGYIAITTVRDILVEEVKKIKARISYSEHHWYTKEEELPIFFVLESTFSGKKFYCHSTNLQFVKDSQNIIGHIFDHEIEYGKLKTITPKEYKILPMTKNEFYDKYLLNRINIMNFTDYREKNEYEKYLIEEFNKNYTNE